MPEISNNKNKKKVVSSNMVNEPATVNLLQRQAFDNSLQANIISIVSTGKIIMVNNAACKLLGYSKKELLTKTRATIFNIQESRFKKMLKEKNAEEHSIARVTAIKKSGKRVPCEITSAVFMGEHGIENAITTIADRSQSIMLQKNIDVKKEKIVHNNIALARSRQRGIDTIKEKAVADNIVLAKSKQKRIDAKKEKTVADNIVLAKAKQKNIDAKNVKRVAADIKLALAKSDTRLAENNEWIKYIARASYDVMWDWDIATGEIYAGDGVEEVFGYKVQNNTVKITAFMECLLPEEKDTVEKKLWDTLAAGDKSWNDSFMFRRQDGSIASVISRASIVRDEEGKAIRLIGAVKDVSRVKELEKQLENSEASIALMNEGIRQQKNIAIEKEKLVAENILQAITKQIDIDVKNKKVVAKNIVLAIAKQVDIDVKNKKTVARNIARAIANQKHIDAKKEKIVARNIALAIAKQKGIDISNKKIVAGNIVRAKAKQKEIDAKNKKIVADNIMLAIAKQIETAAEIKKIVVENIVLAIAKQISIDAKNKKIVAENIAQALAKQKIIDAGKEKTVARNIVLALLKQKGIDAKNEKTVAENILLAQAKSDTRQEENNKIFLLAAKISSDVIWDWDLLTNDLFLGEGFEVLFGYHIKNNNGNLTDWSNHVHPDDKEAVEKDLYDAIASPATHWQHTYRFIRADGSIAKIFARANIIRHADGKAYRMIGIMQDISRQKELEEKLDKEIIAKVKLFAEHKENFKLLFNSSSDVLYDSNLLTNEVTISDAYEKYFGYKITGNMTPAADWVSHIHPDDKEKVFQDYERMLASADNEWK